LKDFRVFSNLQWHKEFDREVNIWPAVDQVGIKIARSFESLPHGDIMDAPSVLPELQTLKEVGGEEGNLSFTHEPLDWGSSSVKISPHMIRDARVQNHSLILRWLGQAERV
jgi:hypothetical protein